MAEHDPLLREVDEAVRHERYAKLWARFQKPIFLTFAALVLLTGGVSGYKAYQRQQDIQFTRAMLDAKALFAARKFDEAATAFRDIAAAQHDANKGVAVLWQSNAERAAGTAETGNATLRDYIEQSNHRDIWHAMACIRLLGSESIPAQCDGTTSGPLSGILLAQTAADVAMKGEWEKASALLNQVMANEHAPQNLKSEILRWQQVMQTQQQQAAMATHAQPISGKAN